MNNKAQSLNEIIIVMIIASFVGFMIIVNLPFEKMDAMDRERKKAQVISTDENGNKLWRVWDSGNGFIYYMPNGQTSWEGSGKGSHPMGVK